MRNSFFPQVLALTLVAQCTVCLTAQSPEPAPREGSANDKQATPGSPHPTDQGPPESNWTFSAGAMGVHQPRYLGSDETHYQAGPYLDLNYKGLVGFQASRTVDQTLGLFYRPLQVGQWSLGVLAMGEIFAREEKYAKALKGMGDRKRGLFYGLEMKFKSEPVEATLEVMKGADKAGLVAGLNLSHGFQFNERWGLDVGFTAVWGDKDYHAWEFGITPTQASRRAALIQAGNIDLRPADAIPFTPKAGIREFRADAMLRWGISERLMAVAMLQHGQLQNDAAKSALTRSKNQTTVGLGFVYMFSFSGHGH